jgi:hypothetical protein
MYSVSIGILLPWRLIVGVTLFVVEGDDEFGGDDGFDPGEDEEPVSDGVGVGVGVVPASNGS